jgi:hypothetical protein
LATYLKFHKNIAGAARSERRFYNCDIETRAERLFRGTAKNLEFQHGPDGVIMKATVTENPQYATEEQLDELNRLQNLALAFAASKVCQISNELLRIDLTDRRPSSTGDTSIPCK